MSEDSRAKRAAEQAGEIVVAAAEGVGAMTLGWAVGGIEGAAVGGAAGAALERAVGALWPWHRERRAVRMARMLLDAGDLAEQTADELVTRLTSTAAGEELLARALSAAQDAAAAGKLRALSRALASGSLAEDDAVVEDEILFVRTVEAVDTPHLRVLVLFTMTNRQLGIHPGRDDIPESIMETLKRGQIETAAPSLASALDPLLAVLQREGLVRNTDSETWFSSGPEGSSCQITPYGKRLLSRLTEEGSLVGTEALGDTEGG